MNRKLKVALASVLIVASLSAVYAGVILTKLVTTSMRVKMTGAMNLYDTDGTTELTSIYLGDFVYWDQWFYPGKLATMPTQPAPSYFVNNTDQITLYVQFVPPEIPGIVFQVWMRRLDQASFIGLIGAGGIYQLPLTSPSLDPDHPLLHSAQWYLSVTIQQPAFGDYNPLLTFNGCDTPEG